MTVKNRVRRLERKAHAEGDALLIEWYWDEDKGAATTRYKVQHELSDAQWMMLEEASSMVVFLKKFSRPKGNGAAVSNE